jgi:hypothetical protein
VSDTAAKHIEEEETMGDTEQGTGAVRTASGQLLGNFAYVLTRVQSGPAFKYDLQITEIQKVPNIVNLRGEELTLELVAGRKVTFAVQGATPDADGLRLDLLVLSAPSEANANRA